MIATDSGRAATLAFEARSVAGHRRLDVSDVQPEMPAGRLAAALAESMGMPADVPWALRAGSELLDDERPIGEQITPGERVTVMPKAHLG